jgi:SAM-dependent methyltransferase
MRSMPSKEHERSKDSFDAVARSYDRYRPAPPAEVLNAIIQLSALRHGSRVLEIGCGTGQLSLPLAQHGVDLQAVELGPRLAGIARRNLARFPNAQVDVSPFEDWPLPEQKFDAVVAANSFHWIDPDIRLAKSAAALRRDGVLTILCVHHVRGGTAGFFADTQRSYTRWGLSDDPTFQPPEPNNVLSMYPELGEHPDFSSVQRCTFEIPRSLSTASYVGWLTTDSLVNTLDEPDRSAFLHDIERLIESKYNGRVSRNFVYEVIVARRAGDEGRKDVPKSSKPSTTSS